jgi:hypothetical protein
MEYILRERRKRIEALEHETPWELRDLLRKGIKNPSEQLQEHVILRGERFECLQCEQDDTPHSGWDGPVLDRILMDALHHFKTNHKNVTIYTPNQFRDAERLQKEYDDIEKERARRARQEAIAHQEKIQRKQEKKEAAAAKSSYCQEMFVALVICFGLIYFAAACYFHSFPTWFICTWWAGVLFACGRGCYWMAQNDFFEGPRNNTGKHRPSRMY